MVERIGGLVAALVPAVLCAYWTVWAYLLITAEMRQLIPRLEREYRSLRRFCWDGTTGGALFLVRLDSRALTVWYRVNRPSFSRFHLDAEDTVSAVGRFEFVETPAWVLPRGPIGRPLVSRYALARRWKQ